ncbi:MAG TPA: UPF0182 family protein [Firmicutes bacterium]|nr:UPF0182 family protein [Bacillota bacterium]
MNRLARTAITFAVVVFFLVILFGGIVARVYTDWLWFLNEGYPQAFWTGIISRIELGILAGATYFIFIYFNLAITRTSIRRLEWTSGMRLPGFITARRVNLVFLLLSLFVSSLAGLGAAQYWSSFQLFLHPSPFGYADPIFHNDVSLYVFRLPFLTYAYSAGMTLVVFSAILVGIVYLLLGEIGFSQSTFRISALPRRHLSFLIGSGFILKAFGYLINAYGILFSPRGVVFGAGYTDVHANLLAFRALSVIAIICGVLVLLYSVFQTQKLAIGGVMTLAAASFLLGSIYPQIVQKLSVEPNELARERPFIEANIAGTRRAFGLDSIVVHDLDITDNLSYGDLARHNDTLSNLRLWDWRPLLDTYSQLQEIRLYYNFHDVDLDRYTINGKRVQVALSPRELRVSDIPQQARTWINQHLVYTHGYGLCMSHVNRVTQEGLPDLIIRDIPPRSIEGPKITRPEIYYGEGTDQYVLVNTRTREFDYPLGEQNIYTQYRGTGGIPISSPIRRLAFAVRFANAKFLLSTEITPESKILFFRSIKDKVSRIAPFLRFDNDPYMVIDNGRLYWIIDAYTTTSFFPYSQPHREGFNYIRNPVKITIDAYNGTVDFYLFDPEEPIARSYSRIFPGMFQPYENMPEGLKAHIRYPEYMFRIQAETLAAYHMTDPDVFYNREDLWDIPTEVYAGSEQKVQPYYMLMRPPGEEKLQYVITIPFTPSRKPNMISWLFAVSDPEDFGRMVLLRFSKQHLVYGPMQVEARIDQSPEISQLLTLWSQRGSSVIRGNLLTIPIENSMLYVEPLYLLAEKSGLPELKRVIAVFGGNIVMAETLEKALAAAFGATPAQAPQEAKQPGPRLGTPPPGLTIPRDLIESALNLYREMQDRARSGDWAGFGDRLRKLGETLNKLKGF